VIPYEGGELAFWQIRRGIFEWGNVFVLNYGTDGGAHRLTLGEGLAPLQERTFASFAIRDDGSPFAQWMCLQGLGEL
jgi:hypothetical protein